MQMLCLELYLSIVGDSDKVKIRIVDVDEIFHCCIVLLSFDGLHTNIHLILFTDTLISTLVNVHYANENGKTDFITFIPTFTHFFLPRQN